MTLTHCTHNGQELSTQSFKVIWEENLHEKKVRTGSHIYNKILRNSFA